MTLRQWLKYRLYGALCRFRYFGVWVYFPPRSNAFKAACEQGIFEADNFRVLLAAARQDTLIVDVGGNIGLTAIPLLRRLPSVKVVSYEPSSNSMPYLARTREASGMRDRWQIVDKALGAAQGAVGFSLSDPADAFFDGLKPTGRVRQSSKTTVEMTTLDAEWARLGRPPVSVIKIDVEGAELEVLRGAAECIAAARPAILLEWNAANVAAYGLPPDEILRTAAALNYRLHAVPTLVPVGTDAELRVHMAFTESFLLLLAQSDTASAVCV